MCLTYNAQWTAVQICNDSIADKQEQKWIPAAHAYCAVSCKDINAHCMCGSRVGEYDCICPRGHQRHDGLCQSNLVFTKLMFFLRLQF